MKKFISVSFGVLVLDRVLKILVQFFLTDDKLYIIKRFFYLIYVKNIGAAFSIMEGSQIILIIIALLALGFLFYYVKKNKPTNIGYAFLFGGIIGNMIDRAVYGYVIDYIGFEIFNKTMPIFNLADIAIVIGAFLVIIGSDKNEVSNR